MKKILKPILLLWVGMAVLGPAAVMADQLGHDGKPGLWEDRKNSNLAFFFAHDLGTLSPKQQQKLSTDSFNAPGGVVRVCATEMQVQHPVLMSLALNSSCKGENMRIAGQTVRLDFACQGGKVFHVEIDFDSPTHRSVIATTVMRSASPMLVTRHDLHWLSADCGDIKPGEMRELVEPPFLHPSKP
jgi:hypothetical protein